MSKHLTAEMIAEALDAEGTEVDVQPAEGWACTVTFVHKGGGVLQATLYDTYGPRLDDEMETRTFRLVEVES